MKSLFISAATLLILTAAVVVNSMFISSFSAGLIEELKGVDPSCMSDDECLDSVMRTGDAIRDKMFLLSLSVGHEETDSLIQRTVEAKDRVGNEEEFRLAIDELICALERLKTSESFCADGIL